MKFKSISLLSAFLFSLSLLLTACGGGSEDSTPATSEQPQVNSTSVGIARGQAGSVVSVKQTSSSDGQQAGGEGQSNDTVSFDIVVNDSYFGDADTNVAAPPTWSVTTGKVILLNVTNLGKEKHNWVIVKPDAKIPIPYEPEKNQDIILYDPGMVYANSKTQLTVVAPDPGEYKVICTVPGHYPFMQGNLVVTKG